jgi:hypothetical protein
MSKRFTDSDKWTNNKWYRSLSPEAKCFWIYICDICDPVGVWDEDMEQASFHVGARLKKDEMLKALGGRVYVFDGGKKWWIVGFCEFQYGELRENTTIKPHIGYIKLLQRHGLWEKYLNADTLCEVYSDTPRGYITPQEKEKEKDIEKEKDKEQEQEKEQESRIIVDEKDAALHLSIKNAFLEKQPSHTFTNWPREVQGIKGIVKKIRSHLDTEDSEALQSAAHQLLDTFWRLTQSADKFWGGQPFTPSVLNSSGIFDRVLKQLGHQQPSAEFLEVLKGVEL